jgi:hypothetical protein
MFGSSAKKNSLDGPTDSSIAMLDRTAPVEVPVPQKAEYVSITSNFPLGTVSVSVQVLPDVAMHKTRAR